MLGLKTGWERLWMKICTHTDPRDHRLVSLTFVCCCLLLAGCRSVPVETTEVGVQPEARGQPGVNEHFLKQDLDVAAALERFESKGREVYDQRAAIIASAALRPGMSVADIGAGTGLFTIPFARAVGPEGVVYSVDISEPFIQYIRERASQIGVENVRGVVCTEREVGLAPDSIDFAFICDTYHHFEYPESTLRSLRRALKPAGEVLIVDFRRVPGESSEWVMNHVRADQATVEAEMAKTGFEKLAELPLLKENYVLRFRSTRH